MRVLSLVSSFDPARGGTQSGARGLVLAAQRAGVREVVAAAGTREARERADRFVASLRAEGVVVEQFPTLPWPPEAPDRWGISFQQAAWAARGLGEFDVLHIHGAWGMGLIAGLLAARRRAIPVVVTPHESMTQFDMDDSRSAARRTQKALLKRVYLHYATLFAFTSELEARDSMPLDEADRRRVVHYPLVDGTVPPASVRARGDGRELRVGIVGRIHPKKNLDVLIEALALTPEHVKLVVAGDARHGFVDLPNQLRARAGEVGIADRIEWLGFVDPVDRSALFDSLDLLAMPSVFESFGMSAAEAMLEGLPVLVSQRTGIAEVIRRHGGGVVTDASPAAVAAALREIDSDRSKLQRMGEAAQVAIRQDLSFAAVGDQLAAIYEEAVSRSAGGRGSDA